MRSVNICKSYIIFEKQAGARTS